MPLFRALAKNMAPMTNADESPTNHLTLFPIYLHRNDRYRMRTPIFSQVKICLHKMADFEGHF